MHACMRRQPSTSGAARGLRRRGRWRGARRRNCVLAPGGRRCRGVHGCVGPGPGLGRASPEHGIQLAHALLALVGVARTGGFGPHLPPTGNQLLLVAGVSELSCRVALDPAHVVLTLVPDIITFVWHENVTLTGQFLEGRFGSVRRPSGRRQTAAVARKGGWCRSAVVRELSFDRYGRNMIAIGTGPSCSFASGPASSSRAAAL